MSSFMIWLPLEHLNSNVWTAGRAGLYLEAAEVHVVLERKRPLVHVAVEQPQQVVAADVAPFRYWLLEKKIMYSCFILHRLALH